jgi:hypothetical protein
MTVGRGTVNELCFAAEGLAATAASTSLRRLGSLVETAPAGRLFSAIATLSDLSAKAAETLEAGARAIDRGDDHAAAVRLARAISHMDDMATRSAGTAAQDTPGFLRKAR